MKNGPESIPLNLVDAVFRSEAYPLDGGRRAETTRTARVFERITGVVVALLVVVLVGVLWYRRETARRVAELRGSANTKREAVFTTYHG